MKFHHLIFSLLIALVASCSSTEPTSLSEAEVPGNIYYFISDDGVFCKSKEFIRESDGRKVSLIGMIHVADPEFYSTVQAEAEQTDLILEESVGGLPSNTIKLRGFFSVNY